LKRCTTGVIVRTAGVLAKVGKVLVNRHPTVGKELPLALHSGQWGEKAERLLGVDNGP